MKVIRLTYRDTDIEPSVFLLLFFRFIGIYAYERFWGTTSIQMEGLEVPDDGEIQCLPVFSAYDCDLFIVGNASDQREYAMLPSKKPSRTVVLTSGESIPGAIDYVQCQDNRQLLHRILNKFLEQQIIDPDEERDLTALADIYVENHLQQLTLKAKYFFTANEDSQIEQFQEMYDSIITKLTERMQAEGCSWGSRSLYYTQYAAINMIYELNSLCTRYKKPQIYNRETLLRLCDLLETGIDGLLGDSVKQLKGQIYDDLFLNPNKAYECYVNCCGPNSAYNSYVFFRKGNYWKDFAIDWNRAVKYYLQAVYIYQEYYRAWYKIGLCYQKLGKYQAAMTAYENVRKCLAERIAGECVRPMEIEHVFMAQMQIANIWEERGNLRRAIEALKWAERMWDMISTTKFYDLMSRDSQRPEEEIRFYQNKTRDNLNISYLYEKQIVLNTAAGNREAVLYYGDKLK